LEALDLLVTTRCSRDFFILRWPDISSFCCAILPDFHLMIRRRFQMAFATLILPGVTGHEKHHNLGDFCVVFSESRAYRLSALLSGVCVSWRSTLLPDIVPPNTVYISLQTHCGDSEFAQLLNKDPDDTVDIRTAG
jgi:hypothetical protein